MRQRRPASSVGRCRTSLPHKGPESEDGKRCDASHQQEIHYAQFIERTSKEKRR
jgi:hypothetical protein